MRPDTNCAVSLAAHVKAIARFTAFFRSSSSLTNPSSCRFGNSARSERQATASFEVADLRITAYLSVDSK